VLFVWEFQGWSSPCRLLFAPVAFLPLVVCRVVGLKLDVFNCVFVWGFMVCKCLKCETRMMWLGWLVSIHLEPGVVPLFL
jgi:hypothetical protein